MPTFWEKRCHFLGKNANCLKKCQILEKCQFGGKMQFFGKMPIFGWKNAKFGEIADFVGRRSFSGDAGEYRRVHCGDFGGGGQGVHCEEEVGG